MSGSTTHPLQACHSDRPLKEEKAWWRNLQLFFRSSQSETLPGCPRLAQNAMLAHKYDDAEGAPHLHFFVMAVLQIGRGHHRYTKEPCQFQVG